MSTKALKKELLAAVVMLLVAAVALSGSTYAWFAMNNTVTVTGMEVTTQVGKNLFIADDTLNSTAKITADASYKTFSAQKIKALLEPTSTVDGKAYFYTAGTNVTGTGAASRPVYTAYDPADTTAFNTNYSSTGAVGYVDYVVQLKAVNTDSTAAKLGLTKLKLTYGSDYDTTNFTDESTPFRAALFVEDITSANPAGNLDAQTVKTIYTPSGAANFTSGMAVNSATTVGSVTYNTAANGVWDVPANTTAYYKVVVRLWLEGEDTKCNSTSFANLTDTWGLDLKFELQAADPGVTGVANIATEVTSTAKVDLSTATLNATNDQVVSGVTFHALSEDGYFITDAALASTSRVYMMEEGYPVDVTYKCILP